jgi:gliding motility-associated-like protein
MNSQKSKYYLIFFILQLIINYAYGIKAGFSYTKSTNCAPSVVRFINNSTRGTGITYTWDFGLGAVVTATDYSAKEQLYTKAGQYTVRLKVTDGINTDSVSSVITIFSGPAAKFTADHIIGCPPMPVKFISTSVPGESDIVSSSWDFRNGIYMEGTSVQYTYTGTGMYDVILKVTDKNGCSSFLESDKFITLTESPKVNFAASDTFACTPPLNVSFTNLSTGSSELKYFWDYGNGSTSAELSNSSVYNSPGNYTVKLKATDKSGCTDSLIKKSYISIGNPKGTLSIYDGRNKLVTRSFLCDGTYRFVYSIAGLPDYKWIITENNNTYTIRGKNSLTYKVTGSGDINIKLVYGKNLYCTDSINVSFIKSYIKAEFSITDTLFCSVPSKLNLTNKSQNADKVDWYLSDKLISSQNTVSYSISQKDLTPLTYQQLYNHEINRIRLPLKLVVSNSGICFDSVSSQVTIAVPAARFLPDKVSGCVPLQISLSDSSKAVNKIDTYTFKIGKDSIITANRIPVNYTIKNPGVYYVREIVKSGTCYDTSEVVKIVAGEKLVPDFIISPAEICNGGNIRLTGNTVNNSLVSMWRFRSHELFNLGFNSPPDTTISVYTDSTGFKDISLQVDYNGCLSDTTKHNILKIKGPTGNIIERFSCDSSLDYHFRSGISPSTSLIWNIDTVVVNDSDSVRYHFPARGDHLVNLTATDNLSGCTLTRTKLIKVRKVLADFTLNDTIFCVGDSVLLDASSSTDYINNCFNEGFLWDFGDNSPPRRTFLTTYDHIYTAKGTDTIKLFVRADNGCTDTARKVVRVFRPTGSFTMDKTSGCLPSMAINFSNTSTDTTIVNWIWNFGDQISDNTNSISVSHTYSGNRQQTFYPGLTVYDAYQCSSNYSNPIGLLGVNNNFQSDDNAICIGQTVTFTPADTSLTDLLWDFGDGTTSAGSSIHTFTKQGKFSVSLSASNWGCRDTLTKFNYISVEKADANFTASDSILSCYPVTLQFKHDNTIGSPVVEYLWSFGSNTLADRSSGNVSYTFTKHGNYLAQLMVRTLNGCNATRSKKITINGPAASITFSPQKICYNQVVNFKLDSIKNINSWKWFFGDGTTSTDNPVSHRYTSRGKIVPTVQLVNSTCNAIRVLDTLTVSKVQAGFISSDSSLSLCIGKKLNFVNRSLFSNSWNWYVDNVLLSTDFTVSNLLLPKTGDYNIKLIAKETNGCADTIIKKFTVAPYPAFSIVGDSILCAGMTFITLSVNKDAGKDIRWTPSTGLSSITSFITNARPSNHITYTALVTNAYGCATSRKKTIMVNHPFNLSRSPLGDTTVYLGERIQLNINAYTDNVSYIWSPNSNISCLNCNNPWVAPSKTITYTVETKNGCFDFNENFNIEVISDFYLEAPSAFTPNGDSNNDLFRFEEKNITNFELKVFNRWGEIVFSTNDVNKGWDGNVNGHAQNTDTFVYLVKAETIHGYKFEKKGEFLLLR